MEIPFTPVSYLNVSIVSAYNAFIGQFMHYSRNHYLYKSQILELNKNN